MRALSGLQATGNIHLGNYIGAVRHWATNQVEYEENFYFVPDLHTLNVRPTPEALKQGIYESVAMLIASGIDPEKSVVYAQSTIPAHSELFNILNNYVTMGELKRMTQFKDKQQRFGGEGAVVGLFEYPVLMAADILLYDVDVVPVGDDQRQHVELTRDIAERFNGLYGPTFKVPKVVIAETGARIMNLQDPTKKMSKSDQDSQGCIFLSDSDDVIRQKISRAITDSDNRVKSDISKPGVSNLMQIYCAVTSLTIEDIEDKYEGHGYGEFKSDLADILIKVLRPIRQKFEELVSEPVQLDQVLLEGKAKAELIAQAKLQEVKEKIGLVTP